MSGNKASSGSQARMHDAWLAYQVVTGGNVLTQGERIVKDAILLTVLGSVCYAVAYGLHLSAF